LSNPTSVVRFSAAPPICRHQPGEHPTHSPATARPFPMTGTPLITSNSVTHTFPIL
jgi:hypothetical protein